MGRSRLLPPLFVIVLSLAGPLSPTRATVSASGDVEPDPTTWTSSTYGWVGNTTDGSLTVEGGSALLSYDGYIGYNSGVTGAVTVTGTNPTTGASSTWTNSWEFFVGYGGLGMLTITNGGVVNNLYAYVGYSSGSTGTVTVDGAGSKWTNNYSLYVGYYGSGTLNITNGGAVSNSSGYIGNSVASTVTVDGAGSKWTNRSGV